ncbi:MAG: helix-turn-helix transcriptional regulator [Zestosphaera sp.]
MFKELSKPLIRLKRKLTIENLWIYVIASLMIKPTYAYHVRKLIKEFFGFSPTTITLYSVIYRLKKSGLIKEELVSGERIYKPTEEGIKELEEALSFMEQTIKRLKEITHHARKQ